MSPLPLLASPTDHDGWLGNPWSSWIAAAAGALVGFVLIHTLARSIRRGLAPRAERTGRVGLRFVVAALAAIRAWQIALIAVAVALSQLDFTATADYWIGLAAFVLVGIQIVRCVNAALVAWLLRAGSSADGSEVPVMLHIVTWVCQFLVWVTFLLAVLTNAGINITAFVASLGVGGIAVALALQTVLGDLFASVAIGLDKPFEPGEFIEFGTSLGTVKRVGIKSTRITSLSGEELSIANSQLLATLVHNYSRMPERRVVFGFTVPYGTTRAQLRDIADRTNAIIQQSPQVRFDRGHFTGFGTDGFTFEFVYYMLDSSYTLYRDVQQQFNDEIIGILESMEVGFAVPPRSVTVHGSAHE